MPRLKINLPHIWPWKFFGICTILFLLYHAIWISYAYFHTEPYSHIDYIGKSPDAKSDILRQIQTLSKTLHAKDYWQEWGPWGVIQSYAFYGYSLVNLYLENKSDQEAHAFASNELKFIYNFLITEGKDHFINQWTEIEHGIIYQGAKNHVLASLVILGNTEYTEELAKNSKFLAEHLTSSPLYSAESYPGIGWYIDNVHAYYSLYLVDILRKKHWDTPLYGELIKNWVAGMKTMKDSQGVTLAEAYGYNPWENQSRWCAQSWLLVYMYEMDRDYFNEQYPLFNEHFYQEKMDLWLITDTADNTPRINQFSWGPSLFGYSSSAVALSLPLYKLTKDTHKFQKIMRTLDFGLDYDLRKGEYTFLHSSLLESLNLWGKTHVTWGDKL